MYAKPRRLTQKRMTLSDLEWPFHTSRAISAVAEVLVCLCFRISIFIEEVDSVQCTMTMLPLQCSVHVVSLLH